MAKPDEVPQDVWDATESVAGVGGGHEMRGYMLSVRIRAAELIAAEREDRNEEMHAAIMAERNSLPDNIDIYQMLKREGLRKRADIAKFIASAIRERNAP